MEATDYCFSFFRKPIQNIEPLRAIGIVDVYRYVVGHYAQPQTETLRSMTSLADVKKYKASHFDYCTFSGLFRKRNENELINGLKWIIPVDLKGWEHSRFFMAVANCIRATGLPKVDMSGSDVARACFLPYDPQAYINPKYNEYVKENIFRPRLGECPF